MGMVHGQLHLLSDSGSAGRMPTVASALAGNDIK
jgi:hypothetical protein